MNAVGNQLLLIIINKRHGHCEREVIVFQWFVFTEVFIYFPRSHAYKGRNFSAR